MPVRDQAPLPQRSGICDEHHRLHQARVRAVQRHLQGAGQQGIAYDKVDITLDSEARARSWRWVLCRLRSWWLNTGADRVSPNRMEALAAHTEGVAGRRMGEEGCRWASTSRGATWSPTPPDLRRRPASCRSWLFPATRIPLHSHIQVDGRASYVSPTYSGHTPHPTSIAVATSPSPSSPSWMTGTTGH